MSNDRHRTVIRWYKRHKSRTYRESLALIDLYLNEMQRIAKKIIHEPTKGKQL